MGKNFWTEYYYKAPDKKVTSIVEYDFNVRGPMSGRASMMGGRGHESYEISTKTELEEVRQELLINIRPWYAWSDTWEALLTKGKHT